MSRRIIMGKITELAKKKPSDALAPEGRIE